MSGRIVFAGLCDKLVDINEKLQIVPQLATSWEYTDPKTLVMHLRTGVAFQDGEPFDAAAAKYSLMRAATLPGSFRRGEISAMDHVDVVDPHTIKIVLKQPSAPFLSQLADRAGMMVAPKAAETEGKNFGLKPVCAGPFRFAERVPEDHITLERFPDYWNKSAIHFDKVVYRVITDSSARLANLKAGAVDLVEYIVPSDAAAVKADPKLSLVVLRRPRLRGHHDQRRQRRPQQDADRRGPAHPQGARILDRPKGADQGRVQRHVHAVRAGGAAGKPVL